jgi:hypothetical protein
MALLRGACVRTIFWRSVVECRDFTGTERACEAEAVLGAAPEILALRGDLERLPLSMKKIERLPDYALALGHAHARFMMALQSTDDLSALATEGVTLRDQLQSDASTLAKRGIISLELVNRFRNGNGYRNIAFDLVGLAEVFVDVWDRLNGRTFVTQAEVERARVIGNRMVQLLGHREQAPQLRDQAAVTRQQAYLLCAEAYEEARHAVQFVRRNEGDADSIAPSLFAGRGGRGSPQEEAPPSLPEPSPSATPDDVAQGAGTRNAVPVGYPGSDPFMS